MSSPPQKVIKKDGVWTVEGRPRETIQLISHLHPPNIPGKSLITLLVTLPPNGATPPHRHGSAAVLALMLRGASRDQMNAEPEASVRGPGESFYEAPGCHHVRGENASEAEEAAFYAVFVVDDGEFERGGGYEGLVVLDRDVEEEEEKG
ncbi:MAG: hypothetical protein LQ344_001404 [Seirophora lacunosa]|nr:MAG: hypothetical protein LQ344_001404 [Seirophora lacunosa]